MKLEIVTLFPGYFDSVVTQSIIGRGMKDGLFDIQIINLRDFTDDKHQTADDKPFGGGGGMVLKIEPLYKCLSELGYGKTPPENSRIVLTSAAGKRLTQDRAVRWSLLDRLTVICGHYLGVDARLLELFEIEEISIGDYVLTGGEAAAGVIVDVVTRLIPGVLGNFESALADSHTEKILGPPVYTRPEKFLGLEVPEVLIGGHHENVQRFRRRSALKKTYDNRPDLLDESELDDDDIDYLNRLKDENKND